MSKRHKREHGRILSVDEETLGTVLTADAAAGATTLTVDDAAEFEDDGTGGWLSINDQVIQYDAVDDDAGTIHLKTALSAAADDGDPVYVWSKLYDTAATVKTALVMVDGEDDNTDPVHATLAEAVQDLPEGLRGEAGENCTLERVSDDEWQITAVGGRPSGAKGVKFYQDTAAVAAAGAQTIGLSHEPIDNSEHLYWHPGGGAGIYQSAATFTRAGRTVSVPDAEGHLQVGDRLTVEYAYRVGLAQDNVLVDWQSSGWKYLPIALSDTTNRAATGFDDSGWSIGTAAFGDQVGTAFNYGGLSWPAPSSSFPVDTALWLRRQVAANGGALTILMRSDNQGDVYWNGVKVSGAPNYESTITLAAADVLDVNTIAIRFADDAAVSSGDHAYADIRIERA